MSIQRNDPVFARQVGPGEEIVQGVSGKTTTYKTLVAGSNIVITNNLTYLQIDGTGGGGGGGSGTVNTGVQYEMAYYATSGDTVSGNPEIFTDASDNLVVNNGIIRVEPGTVGAPSYTFNTDLDTGMYRIAANTLGLSVQGAQAVTVASNVPPAPMIKGLNVGTTTNIGGIQRLCNDSANSWQDGHMGNSTQLVFTPSDFMIANPTHGTPRAPQGALTSAFINLVGNAVNWVQTSGARYGEPTICTANAADCLVATKLIPKGFLIKPEFQISIFGITNTPGFEISVAYRRIENITPPAIPGNVFVDAAYTLNTAVPLTNLGGPGGTDVVGDGTGFLILYIQPPQQLVSTDGGIRGAIIQMSRY